MNDVEKKLISEKLIAAFEAHETAATKFREAIEFAAPLTGSKPELLKNARRAEMQQRIATNEVQRNLKNATPATIAKIFKGITGE
jgi:hypothetical protein